MRIGYKSLIGPITLRAELHKELLLLDIWLMDIG